MRGDCGLRWRSGIWTTTTPTGPGWKWKSVYKTNPYLNFDPSGVACPSTRLCVVTDAAGNILTSTDPARRRWRTGRLPGLGSHDFTGVDLASLSCPSVRLCLSAVGPHTVAVSTNPAGGAHTWRTTGRRSTHLGTEALTCASVRLCVATLGDLVLSTPHPAGGDATWRSSYLDQGYNPLTAIACPSEQLCVGIDGGGNLITSSAPSPSATAWNVAPLAIGSQTAPMPSLACPSASWCAATTTSGSLITSADPANAGAWSSTPLGLNDVSCPTATFCVGSDDVGAIHMSGNPSGGASAWRSRQVTAAPQCERQYCTYDALTVVSCPSTNLCATTDGQSLWVSTDPAAAEAAWTKSALPQPNFLFAETGVYCPTDSLCLSRSGAALEVTTDPVDAAPQWTAMNLPNTVIPATFVPYISGLSCVSAQLCVAVDTLGYAFVGNPAGPNSWTATKIDYSPPVPAVDHGSLTGVSCTPSGRCVAVDGKGNVIVGTTSG